MYSVITAVAEAVAAYCILVSPPTNKLVLLCAMKLVFTIARSIVYLIWVANTGVRVRFSVTDLRWPLCRQLIAFGLKNSLLFGAYALIRSMILLVITHFVGVAAVVFFVIPSRLVEYAYAPADSIGHPLFPFFTALAAKRDMVAIRKAWLHTTRLLQLLTIGISVAVVWLGEPFIRRWMGPQYASLGYTPLLILTAGLFVKGIAVNANRLLMSLARHGQIAVFTAGAAIVCFGLSAPLTRIAGISGAALSVTLFMAVVGWWEIVLASRELHESATKHITATLVRFVIPCVAASLVFKGLLSYAYPANYSVIVFHGLIGGGTYLVTATLFALSRRDRQFLWDTMRVSGVVCAKGTDTPSHG